MAENLELSRTWINGAAGLAVDRAAAGEVTWITDYGRPVMIAVIVRADPAALREVADLIEARDMVAKIKTEDNDHG
jgi:antitoxin (DNA-binding transcriptional repressor) of toxin-antitoxin stability system